MGMKTGARKRNALKRSREEGKRCEEVQGEKSFSVWEAGSR